LSSSLSIVSAGGNVVITKSQTNNRILNLFIFNGICECSFADPYEHLRQEATVEPGTPLNGRLANPTARSTTLHHAAKFNGTLDNSTAR
jgi:hypothetical protein